MVYPCALKCISLSIKRTTMKKLILIFLLSMMLPGIAGAACCDSIPNTWELDKAAWKAWDKIDSAWMDSIYWNCLKRNNLKMKCSSCDYIYIKVDFSIDSLGRLTEYKVASSNICSQPVSQKLEAEFMDYFKALEFPAVLRNLRFRAMLGTGLKC